MNTPQSNRLAMYIAVQVFLNSITATAGLAALAEKLALLKTLIVEILKLAGTQSTPTAGAMEAREQALAEATDLALIVAGGVLSFAKNRPELAAKVRVNRTQFLRMRRSERMQLAQRIHDAAASVIAQLGGHGLLPPILEELQTKINATEPAINAPRTTAGEKKVATSRLAEIYRQVDDLLENDVDLLLRQLQRTNPTAWQLYQDARTVYDRPGVRSAPEESSTPATTATPAAPVPAKPTPQS